MQDLQVAGSDQDRAPLITVGLSFLLLLTSVVLVVRSTIEGRSVDRAVIHTLDVKRHVAELTTELTSAESGQRGYLFTGDADLLAALNVARREIDEQLKGLRKLVSDNPEQVRRIDELRPVIRARLAAADKVLELYRQGNVEEAAQLVRTRGQALMLDCRLRLAALDDAESRLLIERQEQLAAIRMQFSASVTAMLLAGGLLAVFALVSMRRYTKSLAISRERLAKYNSELETRVNERTTELVRTTEIATRERTRAESLLTDVNHRVGNHLALVSAFLTMQLRAARHPDAIKALEAARSRVQTIASAHRKLRLGADFASVRASEVLGAVIDDIAAGLPPGDLIRIHHQVDPIEINARDAVSLGVLTSELVMNAARHAFPAGASGEVHVIFSLDGARAPFLEVTDDGVGLNGKVKHDFGGSHGSGGGQGSASGLGSTIIDMVSRQFRGRLERSATRDDTARPGTRVRIELDGLHFIAAG
jgi:two-component sensor histidine kinase/CHASE3 domain sensor protein